MQLDSGNVCDHGDLEKKVKGLERQLTDRSPDLANLKQELEDTNE